MLYAAKMFVVLIGTILMFLITASIWAVVLIVAAFGAVVLVLGYGAVIWIRLMKYLKEHLDIKVKAFIGED